MKSRQGALLTALFLPVLLLPAPLRSAPETAPPKPAAGRLSFVKTFKNSHPEYMRVAVEENGDAVFYSSPEKDNEPDSFRLSPGVTQRLFALAAQLSFFRSLKLEGPTGIAYLGTKTFTYEKGRERSEVSFNYTEDPAAKELQDLFESIGRGRFLLQQLEFRLSFDRLGVLEALREFEREFNAGRLVDWDQFAPVLERIASDRRLMRVAQNRAQDLLRRIRGAPGRLEYEYGDQYAGWYFKVVVEEQGTATYERRRYDAAPNPQPLPIPAATRARLWELVRLGNNLRGLTTMPRGPSERLSGHRLTYEGGPEHNEVAFSSPPDAVLAEITHIFKQALQQEHFRQRLRTAAAEGGVGLQLVLQELETAVLEKQLIEPKEFVPLLEAIANGSDQHPMTREQAQRVLARLQVSP